MRDTHFAAIIVGSGFGGSVRAYRLAEAGLSVCVLERGKAYPPGEFPSPPPEAKELLGPQRGAERDVQHLVVQRAGGGSLQRPWRGSLIYANILIRKLETWFVKENLNGGGFEYWPVTRADLDPHYDQVEKMLGAKQYPIDEPPYNEVPKAFSRADLWPRWMPALGPEPRPRPGPEAIVGPPVDTPPVPLRVARDCQDRRGEGRAKG